MRAAVGSAASFEMLDDTHSLLGEIRDQHRPPIVARTKGLPGGPKDLGNPVSLAEVLIPALVHAARRNTAGDITLVELQSSGADVAEAVRLFQDDVENRCDCRANC